MIQIQNRYEIPKILLKRAKLQEKFVEESANTAAIHEHNYIKKKKHADFMLTIWLVLLVAYIVIVLSFYLYDILNKTYGIIITIILGVSLISFLIFIGNLFRNATKLKKAWDVDSKKDLLILEEINKCSEEIARLGLMIMTITEHSYILSLHEEEKKSKWETLIYEYVDAIDKYYKGANIEDYINFYLKWDQEHKQ